GDGFVSPEEFARGAMAFGKRPPGAPATPQPGTPPAGRPGVNMADRSQIEELFDRTDSNSDGKLTKDEIPEERRGMRMVLEQSGSDTLTKEQLVRGMLALMQADGQPPRPEGAPPRPDATPGTPGSPSNGRPNGPPGPPTG